MSARRTTSTPFGTGPGVGGRRNGNRDLVRVRVGPTTCGIFDTFANEDDRRAHLSGQIPAALAQIGADLLAGEPDIRQIDIVAVK
jgi:hypothetical protein